jgi:hypothetical protein
MAVIKAGIKEAGMSNAGFFCLSPHFSGISQNNKFKGQPKAVC